MGHVPTPVAVVIDEVLEATVALSFSKWGYVWRKRLFGWQDPCGSDATRGLAVVTGGSTGIGREIAAALSAAGQRVVIVSRDEARGQTAAASIAAAAENASVVHHAVDLTSLAAAQDFATLLTDQGDAVELLVHNAGAIFPDYRQTAEGHEATMALHVLAPFLLTTALAPLLTASTSGAVVTITSGGMYTKRLAVDALRAGPEGFDGVARYAMAKRAQVELTGRWAQHFGTTVAVHTMHPGWVDTAGLTSGLPAFARRMAPLLRSPQQGADTAVWLACRRSQLPSGRLWMDRRPRSLHRVPFTRAPALEVDRLWDWCTDRTRGPFT